MININSITNIYSSGSDRINQKQASKSASTRAKKTEAVSLVVDGKTVEFVAKKMDLNVQTLSGWVTKERNGKY